MSSGRENGGMVHILFSLYKPHPKEAESGTRVQHADDRSYSRYLRRLGRNTGKQYSLNCRSSCRLPPIGVLEQLPRTSVPLESGHSEGARESGSHPPTAGSRGRLSPLQTKPQQI